MQKCIILKCRRILNPSLKSHKFYRSALCATKDIKVMPAGGSSAPQGGGFICWTVTKWPQSQRHGGSAATVKSQGIVLHLLGPCTKRLRSDRMEKG